MTLALLAVLIGFVVLVWSADQFVTGAAATAGYLGMSRLMIGLTVVAFGTSAPEIFVSLNAALADAGDMAIGNALGSNLANVGMVLAITALITRIPIPLGLLSSELPVLAVITALAGYTLWDHHVGLLDGGLLFLSLLVGGGYIIWAQKAEAARGHALPDPVEDIPAVSQGRAWLLLLMGLVLLIASSNLLVWGAKEAAQLLGVSQLVIGLTLVAVGTSLPELAASVACALKGHVDIALGNVVGSNIFNIAAVMAIPGLLGGVALEAEIFTRDYLFMAGITLILIVTIVIDSRRLVRAGNRPGSQEGLSQAEIGRIAACLFLLVYAAYYATLFNEI